MKITSNIENNFRTGKNDKKVIKVKFIRYGKKNGKYTKEKFWITVNNEITRSEDILKALTLEDLKNIVESAENLIKEADSE
ncbi:hypothetical protein [Chryseobacterium viscerum]|uniref:Uncharacterized protein n=1 Tax=Chryseobacterium viscerum TaxID=1037377 RepID=A0A5N4BJ89_9FLAO|nr:hypothetical protein [Chryseobacterium viscerum]KAB1228473.1 hypothetical protein F8D52_22635 [Chryseobacterium viscerum]